MPETHRGRGWVGVVAVVLIVAMIGSFLYRTITRKPVQTVTSQPSTTTAPTTQPDTRPAAPKHPADLIDVARLAYPEMPTTQPLSTPLRLSEAARLVLDEPIYVGPSWRPDLWITRPDARPTREVLSDATDPEKDAQVFVTTERVAYAHWSITEFGRSKVQLVVEKPGGQGYELVSLLSRLPFPASSAGRRYEWDRAMSVDDWVAVPAGTGVSVLRFGGRRVEEQFFDLRDPAPDAPAPQTKPQILYAGTGTVLAWLPWENGKPGGRAARYSEGAWVDLSQQAEWNAHYLHLVPLLDGSVLQLVAKEPDAKAGQAVEITLTSPPRQGEPAVKEQELVELVAKLADPDRDERDKAFRALTRYGPSVYPVLQRLSKTAPPEAAARLQQLLRVQVRPTLGGMTLVGDRLQLVSRQRDGGAVFYSPGGVLVPQDQGSSPTIESPAWIAISPGRAVELLPRYMTVDLDPAATRLWSTAGLLSFDWIVSSNTRGPRWWIGNGFAPLLRKSDSAFKEFVARDRRGRWVLRESGGEPSSDATATTTRAAETRSDERSAAVPRTLLIDPSLPDPNPRLPVWEFRNATATGWDKDNWVAASYAEGNWTLREQGWQAMKKDDRMFTRREEIPPTTMPSTEPTTSPATGPASSPTTQAAAGPALLTTNDGTHYFDGRTSLRVVAPGGKETVWPLPPEANGTGPVTLLRTADGHLFLYNQPGRVLRIKPTPGQSEPFKLEATFTKGVPTVADPTRIWLDPAGRIVMVYEDRLAVMFPLGYIPPKIQELMEPEDLEKLAE